MVYRQRHARLGDLPAHRSRLRAGVDEPKSTYRQVTDAHLLTLARRRGVRLVTFDAGVFTLAQQRPKTPVELLTIL